MIRPAKNAGFFVGGYFGARRSAHASQFACFSGRNTLKLGANLERRLVRVIWQAFCFLVPALLLGGCALPPAIMVASYSADIVSYAATGKTVTDHAYSAVARSDCSFVRILHDKPICVDEPSAALETQVARAGEVSKPDRSAPARDPVGARTAYVQIGSFHDPANAERARTHYADYHAVIVSAHVHGQTFHRLVAGPLTTGEAASLKQKMVAATSRGKNARG